MNNQNAPSHEEINSIVIASTNTEIIQLAKIITAGCFTEIAKLPPEVEFKAVEDDFQDLDVSFAISKNEENKRIFLINNSEEFSYISNRAPIYFSQIYFKPNIELGEGIFYIFPNNYSSKELNFDESTTVIVMATSVDFSLEDERLIIKKDKPRIFDVLSNKELVGILQNNNVDINSKKIKGEIGIEEFLQDFENLNSTSLQEYWEKEKDIRNKSRNLTDIKELTQQLILNIEFREKNFTHAISKVLEGHLKGGNDEDSKAKETLEKVLSKYQEYKSEINFYKNAYKKLSSGETADIYISSTNSAIEV